MSKEPCEIIEINARNFKVQEFYLDMMIKNCEQAVKLSRQDKDLLFEVDESKGQRMFDKQKPQIKEGVMRIASLVICDIIEKLDMFKDKGNKKSILCFLPGLAEIFQFMDFIQEYYKTEKSVLDAFEFIPLHSSLNDGE